MNAKDWPRLAISAGILVAFGYALLFHWSTGLEETLKNVVIAAVMYWLGSSKGSADKTDIINRGPSGERDDPVHVEPQP